MDNRFPLSFPPGMINDDSAYSIKGRYFNGSMVRPWKGRVQKWGGWGNYYEIEFPEPIRGGRVWNVNDGTTLAAMGSANKLYVIKQGEKFDVTPEGLPEGLIDYSTAADSGYGSGGYGSGPYGGGWSSVPGQGAYPRVWTIDKWGEDMVACPRGGAVYYWDYSEANIGLEMVGTAASGATTVTALGTPAEINVGDRVEHPLIPENTFVESVNVGGSSMVISNPVSGVITAGTLSFTTPAVTIDSLTADTQCPIAALGIFVTDDRHLVVYGAAQDPLTYDALNVAWCNREDFTEWTPSDTNTAGSIRCESGNQIMGAVKVAGAWLIITDLSAHPFKFIGGDDIFGLDRIGSTGGACGPQSMAEMDGVAFWMGFHGFFSYNGRVNVVQCPVAKGVFDNINRSQLYKVIAGTNRRYDEVVWFIPGTLTVAENDSYVSINVNSEWSIGGGLSRTIGSDLAEDFSRTMWIDSHALFRTPLAVDAENTASTQDEGLEGGNDVFTKILLHLNGDETKWTDSNAGGSTHTWAENLFGGQALVEDTTALGGSAMHCPSVGSYIGTTDHADFNIGSSDFTISCRFKVTAAGGTQLLMAGQMDAAATPATVSFYIERMAANNTIRALFGVGGSNITVASTTTFTDVLNTGWHHLLVARSGSTLYLFIDGVLEATASGAGTINDSSDDFRVGAGGEVAGGSWIGYLDEFRLDVGVARHTENFEVPTHEYGARVHKLYQQESGSTADGEDFSYVLESGEVELQSEGMPDTYTRLKKIVPDYAYVSGEHSLYIEARGYPSDPAVTKGPYDIGANLMFNPKARGRSFRFIYTGTGDFRIGDQQAYGVPDGGRR
jgi:hypothetical protein